MATVAVFVALGGTSYAVATNSIGSREIKNGSVRSKDLRNNDVRGKDIRNGTITGNDVRDGTLQAGDFKAGALPRGEKGDTGEPGSALAYARVNNDGTVDGSRAKNVDGSNVSSPSGGVYCFDGFGFTPRSVVATPETTPRIVNVFALNSDSPSCPGDEDFLITTRDPAGTLQNDTPFHVLIN